MVGLLPRRVDAKIRTVELPDCAAELVCANGVSADRAILYLHGGAFMTCGINTHRALVARPSKEADAAVLNIGCRMLPRYGLAAAIDDAVAGLRWLQGQGYTSDQIVIAGDSAGGYLAHRNAGRCAMFTGAALEGFARESRDRRSVAATASDRARQCTCGTDRCTTSRWRPTCFRRAAEPCGYVGDFVKQVTDTSLVAANVS